jgi:hypothetical protein
VRKSALNNSAKAKTVTEVKREIGTAGAVLEIATDHGSLADERAAGGGDDGRQKKGADKPPRQTTNHFNQPTPRQRAKLA